MAQLWMLGKQVFIKYLEYLGGTGLVRSIENQNTDKLINKG